MIRRDTVHVTDDLIFSEDFSLGKLRNEEYFFNEKQAVIMACLVKQYTQTGFTILENEKALKRVFTSTYGRKIRDIFKQYRKGKSCMHPAWGILIGPGPARGTIRLIPASK